jgi:hypothetical protein
MVQQKSRQVRHTDVPQGDACGDDQHGALAARERLGNSRNTVAACE